MRVNRQQWQGVAPPAYPPNGLYGFEEARLESQAADLQKQRWAVDAELHRGRRRSRVAVIRGPRRRGKRVDGQWRGGCGRRGEGGGGVGPPRPPANTNRMPTTPPPGGRAAWVGRPAATVGRRRGDW